MSRRCERRAPVGIILTPSPGLLEKTVTLLRGVPVVQYSRRHALLSAPSASIDGEQGLLIGTSHLLQLGLRRIGYIGAERDRSTRSAERLAGYAKSHKRFNIPVDPTLAYLGPTHRDFGLAAVTELLNLANPPSAFILGSGAAMPGALSGFRLAGLKVPEDLSLVGFGDPPWSCAMGEMTGSPRLECPCKILQRPRHRSLCGNFNPPTLLRMHRCISRWNLSFCCEERPQLASRPRARKEVARCR